MSERTIDQADLWPSAMRETRMAMQSLLGIHYMERVAVYVKLIKNLTEEHHCTPAEALQQIVDILDATAATINHVTLGLLVAAVVEIGEDDRAQAATFPATGGMLYAG